MALVYKVIIPRLAPFARRRISGVHCRDSSLCSEWHLV